MIASLVQFPSNASTQMPPDRYRAPMNVHGTLDDYGLNPYEFRVLGHISRRGQCWEGRELMGRACGMSGAKAWESVQVLVRVGLVRERRGDIGHANVYELEPDQSKWADSSRLESVRIEVSKRRRSGSKSKAIPVYPVHTTCIPGEDTCIRGEEGCIPGTHKVNPIKLIQEVNPINQESHGSQANASLTPLTEEVDEKAIAVQPPEEPKAQAEVDKSSAVSAKKSKSKRKKPSAISQYHPDRCAALWDKWRPFLVEVRQVRDSLQGFVAGYDTLIEEGSTPDEIEEGTLYYITNKLKQFRQDPRSATLPPDGIRFFRGSTNHLSSYCLDALALKRERESDRQNNGTATTPAPIPDIDWDADTRSESWLTELERQGPHAFCRDAGTLIGDRRSFVLWALGTGRFECSLDLEDLFNG